MASHAVDLDLLEWGAEVAAEIDAVNNPIS